MIKDISAKSMNRKTKESLIKESLIVKGYGEYKETILEILNATYLGKFCVKKNILKEGELAWLTQLGYKVELQLPDWIISWE